MKRFISIMTVLSLVVSMLIIAVTPASAAWDGTTVATGFASGSGTAADPYVIATPEQLAYLAQSVKSGEAYTDKYFVLSANIDLGGKEWLPIGYYIGKDNENNAPFAGSFDGKGHKVSNFKVVSGAATYAGLFGHVVNANAELKNVVVAKAEVSSATSYAAAFVACAQVKTVQGITVESDVSVSGKASVGGVAGRLIGAAGIYLVNKGTVTGINDNSSAFIGGVSGTVGGGATLKYAVNHGTVGGTAAFIGGITGITGGNDDGGILENCYNDGAVSYTGTLGRYIGGIVGAHAHTANKTYLLKNCYNLSTSVTSTSADAKLGTIAGQSRSAGANFESCYTVAIESVDVVGDKKADPGLTDCGVKTEAEIKVLTAAIDKVIADNTVTPSAGGSTPEPKPSPSTGDATSVAIAALMVAALAGGMIAKKKSR